MNINNFLNIPLVKIVVTILFFYYIFEQTKDDPRSASYQLKNADFDQSVGAIKTALKLSSESAKMDEDNSSENLAIENMAVNEFSKYDKIIFNDELIGQSGPEVLCGSDVFLQYSIQDKLTKDNLSKATISLKIGNKTNWVLEKGLVGMKSGGIRSIDIPSNFKTGDSLIDNAIKSKPMIYKVSLVSVINPQNVQNCEL